MGTYKCCIFFTRRFALIDATTPEDVRTLFSRFSGGAPYMGVDELRRYLAATGESDGDGGGDGEMDAAERIVDRILQGRSRTPRFGKPALTVDDFHSFLFSEELNPPIRESKVHHDMNAPLSNYFIYTGHNSYLTGNQLSSDCSDAPIIKALQIGVRVIELDMWPNSSKDDIDILHGRTLTAPVSLMKCLTSIKEYAFVASPYPVIITLEDHLTSDLQAKVAKSLIRLSIANIDQCMQSGCVCSYLIESFSYAKEDELPQLENLLLDRSTEMSTGMHSNFLMHHVLEHGTRVFKRRLVERLMEDLANLCNDQYGNYVVQTCLKVDNNGESELMDLVIRGFNGMTSARPVLQIRNSEGAAKRELAFATGHSGSGVENQQATQVDPATC